MKISNNNSEDRLHDSMPDQDKDNDKKIIDSAESAGSTSGSSHDQDTSITEKGADEAEAEQVIEKPQPASNLLTKGSMDFANRYK